MDLTGIYLGIIIFLICLVIKYLTEFYSNVNKYPPGPIPLPILGNLLLFITRRDKHPYYAIQDIGQKYGKLFTFWIGSKPAIIVFDMNTGKELFNKFDFSGRPNSSLNVMVSGEGYESFIFMDYSKEVQVLRKVSIEALRQLMSGSKFPSVVNQAVDKFVSLVKTHEKSGAFSPLKYTKFVFLSILAELNFGKKYEFGDKELDFISETYELFNTESVKMILIDFIPITKYIFQSTSNIKAEINKVTDLHKINFDSRVKQYKNGSCDTVCDSIITARNKLIEEGKESSKYLTDTNLIGSINILFVAGSDTSICTLNWILLLVSYYPDMQQKLRNEVLEKIGNIEPNLSHKNDLHYVNAFISEALRFRNVVPMGLYHTTMNQTNISGYSIPKNTTIFLHQHSILHDSNYWSEPEKFIPERFLDSNQMFISTRFPAFIPFGTGKRICVGERLAFDMEFLVLTRLMQATNGYQFALADDKHSVDLTPHKNGFFALPNSYKLCLKVDK